MCYIAINLQDDQLWRSTKHINDVLFFKGTSGYITGYSIVKNHGLRSDQVWATKEDAYSLWKLGLSLCGHQKQINDNKLEVL